MTAVRALGVLAVFVQAVHEQRFAVKAPHFGHAQGSIDVHAAEGTSTNIDLESKIGRRVDGQINFVLVAHGGFMFQVITTICLQAALHIFPV